ncbi:hypothetical protein BC826DRAFT_1020352, partial [Russula brevipes]
MRVMSRIEGKTLGPYTKIVQSPVTANIIAQGALPSAVPTDGPSEDSRTGKTRLGCNQNEFHGPWGLCRSSVQTFVMAADCCGVGQAMIEMLPDDVLLEIFDFYLNDENSHGPRNVDKWHTLVHVCRRWRNVVFASPSRLDLRLLCRKDRPLAMLDIWPALPINIE